MLASAIIVFREILEAALVIGLVSAATKGVLGRGAWIASGVAGGAVIAALVAASAGVIASSLAGVGQELFNAAILGAAVVMLAWHMVWMGRHGREMAQEMKALGHAVTTGTRPLHVLALVVGLAVMREGSEVALFLYGIAVDSTSGMDVVLGAGFGLLIGVATGIVLYRGLMRIPTRHLFMVTNVLILLLACGMASQAVAFLVDADVLPSFGTDLWDSSAILSQHSVVGQVLHTLVGYVEKPLGIQVVAYGITLATIMTLSRLLSQPRPVISQS